MSQFAETTKISKKSWNAEEDALLMKLIGEYGTNGSWSLISNKMGNRSGKQCRERYHNHLKNGITKVPWTKEEDELLNESQRIMGNQWAKIAKLLPGRSDNSVKNRWHIINRHRGADNAAAGVQSGKDLKKSRPAVPKLSFSTLGSASIMPGAQQPSLTPLLPASTNEDEFDDLMSFYYSHNSHGHEITLSSRSDIMMKFGSGRRDGGVTAASPREALMRVEEEGPLVAGVENADDDDALLEQTIDMQSLQLGSMSFNNTLNSLISEITMEDAAAAAKREDDDAWIDDLVSPDQVRVKKDTARVQAEIAACPMRNDDAVRSVANGYTGNAETIDYDTFSEPAMSYRAEIIDILLENESVTTSKNAALKQEDTKQKPVETEAADYGTDSECTAAPTVVVNAAPAPHVKFAVESCQHGAAAAGYRCGHGSSGMSNSDSDASTTLNSTSTGTSPECSDTFVDMDAAGMNLDEVDIGGMLFDCLLGDNDTILPTTTTATTTTSSSLGIDSPIVPSNCCTAAALSSGRLKPKTVAGNRLLRNTPRSTPRSPACAHQDKRRRASHTPRSPFRV